MLELTAEQRQAILSGETVRMEAPEIGKNIVVLLEERFQKLQDSLAEEQEDQNLQRGWQKLAYRGLALSLEDEP
jgi:hypothetical protein